VFVEVPANLYLFTHSVDPDAERARPAHGAAGPGERAQPAVHAEAGMHAAPDADAIDRAVTVLDAAQRPLLYVGLGALRARDALVPLAERLDAPVFSTFQGKGIFPESHPLFVWPGFGAAAPPFARRLAADCDAVLAIGCRFGEVATGSYGLELPGPLVHIDIDPNVPGRNYAAAAAIHADAAAAVAALLAQLANRPQEPALRRRIADGHRQVETEWEAARSADRVTPFTLLRAIQRRLGRDTVFTTDSGNGTFLAMEMLRLDGPGRFLAPVDYSCMGYAVPAAIGAALAVPERPVVALAGDGAFLMTGLELLTAASYGIPVAIFVLRDGELAQIAQFQETALNRKSASAVHDYDLAALCAALGVDCLHLSSDGAVDGVLDVVQSTLRDGRPVVVDVAIDYAHRTWFTRGVVRTNLGRLPWTDRLRFIGRAIGRRVIAPARGRASS
ncbi:MAG TPA: thiamine pyrophosphate-dependent enzyme, partial [Longimicrobiales bacterium]